MKPEEQNIAIAESLGWTRVYQDYPNQMAPKTWCFPESLPNFHGSLDAMAVAEATMENDEPYGILHTKYTDTLITIVKKGELLLHPDYKLLHASAPQRAEAYLKTLALWIE